jgi:SAM-dependent methyltransferase
MDSLRAQQLRDGVWKAYSRAAERPDADHPFPVGKDFAEQLGYPKDLLERIPAAAREAFSGVSNVALFAEISEGTRVLDLGCGAGLDSLIAAHRTGPQGRVIGIDFSDSMQSRAAQAAAQAGLDQVEFRIGSAEQIPLDAASVDVALVNGIFNLNPARDLIFQELARVVRPGGAVYAAEIILRGPLPPEALASETDWFA